MAGEPPVGGITTSPCLSLAVAKAGYFGTYFALAAVQPYYGLFLAEKGFDPDAVGMVTAMMPICNLALLPLLSYVADRHRCNAHIAAAGVVLATVALLFACVVRERWLVALGIILHFVGSVPLAPFMDQHTMAMFPEDRRREWGVVRSYGTYGWGIGAPFVACLVWCFGWASSGVVFAIGVVATLHCMYCGKPYDAVPPTEMRCVEVLMFILQHKQLLVCWVAMCCMGMGYVIISTYLFIFLAELGAHPVLLGLSVTATVVIEIPLFCQSRWLLDRFTEVQLMTAAMVAWVVRVLGYSVLHNPWLVLFLEPLHGFTFGAMWLAGVSLVQRCFPADLSSSSMGFLTVGMFGVGSILGNVMGGFLYGVLGARRMLRATALSMTVVCALFRICIAVCDWMVNYTEVADVVTIDGAEGGENGGGERGVSEMDAVGPGQCVYPSSPSRCASCSVLFNVEMVQVEETAEGLALVEEALRA
ncbi:MFS transporter, PPP family, 3-phenylpropionic acid transporter [Trypanosoma grayi]|uniref:MFS transporter, PPP family, 3-phenylpropionic acid transporter n=1 Tax=Trypanosoma grayi TaxID=71804 RepID=UPI0004F46BA1|nr:MFS transporter, PPP family, 3-phenylpropionic acid transporter [Trypanosoma grayi]KEG08874.1 MFS transporter, PPP family, 3-phenylpropionic acid transporter [Trypanosoma grayi]